MENSAARKLNPHTQRSHIYSCKRFAAWLKRSPDTDDGGSDVFVHVHEVEAAGMKTLVAGQVLKYNVAPARDGRLKAVNLRLL